MLNRTGGDKPPDRPAGFKNGPKPASGSEWTIWYTVKQVEDAIRARQERRYQFTGTKKR